MDLFHQTISALLWAFLLLTVANCFPQEGAKELSLSPSTAEPAKLQSENEPAGKELVPEPQASSLSATQVQAPVQGIPSNDDYVFDYKVNEFSTGDHKGHSEIRTGDVVQGSYELAEADGGIRRVEYTADPVNGFRASVHKIIPSGNPAPVVLPTPIAKTAEIVPVPPSPKVDESSKDPDSSVAKPTLPILPHPYAYPYSYPYHLYPYSYPYHAYPQHTYPFSYPSIYKNLQAPYYQYPFHPLPYYSSLYQG